MKGKDLLGLCFTSFAWVAANPFWAYFDFFELGLIGDHTCHNGKYQDIVWSHGKVTGSDESATKHLHLCLTVT